MKSIVAYVIIFVAIGILVCSAVSLTLFLKGGALDVLSQTSQDVLMYFRAQLTSFWGGSPITSKAPSSVISEASSSTNSTNETAISNLTPTSTPKPPPRQVGSASSVSQYTSNQLPKEQLSPLPAIIVDTNIISGPADGAIIEEITEVIFKFEANVFPSQSNGQITFETKVEGLDKDWQTYYSNQRTIYFPVEPKEYTFLVRARFQKANINVVDLTPAKRTLKINTSPYFGKIKISNAQPETSYYKSLITLRAYFYGGDEKINITGWRIQTKKGSFIIPQGVEKYNPALGLVLGDIFVKSGDTIYLPGDTIYLSTEASSLGIGKNKGFRPNKCFGYYYNFPNKNCPRPKEEELVNLDPYCQEYILQRATCETPAYREDAGVLADSKCVSYIKNFFSYVGCFNNYSKDEDFLKNEWYIYMNKDIISEGIDNFYLRDKNGLLVDKYLKRYSY